MQFARRVWKLLVGIKDGLVLLFMLLFFGVLYALLAARPSPAQVQDGALLLALNGAVVEERSVRDPLETLLASEAPMREYAVRDLDRAIRAAATDDRIKAVVLDLSLFTGGGQVHLQALGEALDSVRAAKKPVLAYAIGYGDDALLLAAHASEVWIDPLGGAIVAGPGGNQLFYGRLLEKLKVNAHIYKVGTFKDAVEPYQRNDQSPESKEARRAIYAALWEEWQADVQKARPGAKLDAMTADPVGWLRASGGDMAAAAKAAGLVDRIGSRVAFGQRVAEVAGEDPLDEAPGAYAHTGLATFLAAHPAPSKGKAIGVVTVAGEIVDGDAAPGSAAGERIAGLLDEALEEDLAGLVVRVDSPGGSVLASEQIREAIERHKAKGRPVAVSMANYAASGGYWVATPAARIFAEPSTITGSIGIFAVIPSFERTLADVGVTGDGVRTTPLSGQPDPLTGFTPEVDALFQSSIEHNYGRFVGLVATARGKTPQQVDAMAQGRVWDGGTARQLGLVDEFGGIEQAVAWVAGQAKLKDGDWHARYLEGDYDPYGSMLERLLGDDQEDQAPEAGRDLFALAAERQREGLASAWAGAERLLSARGAQAYCLDCPVRPAPLPRAVEQAGWRALLARLLG